MRYREILFEMSNLNPSETGLPFAIWISPREASHDVRIKATLPPWGSKPEAIYSVRPFAYVAGDNWLSADQEAQLRQWVEMNATVLVDYWEGRIQYDDEVRKKLRSLGNAPPVTRAEAVAALRAIAPKVIEIQWDKGTYYLVFDKFMPNEQKVTNRFRALGYDEPIALSLASDLTALVLWKRSPVKPVVPPIKQTTKNKRPPRAKDL